MKLYIKGTHTMSGQDFDYESFRELTTYIHDNHCYAVIDICPTSIDGADILIDSSLVKDMLVKKVIEWCRQAFKAAKTDLMWPCWDENSIN